MSDKKAYTTEEVRQQLFSKIAAYIEHLEPGEFPKNRVHLNRLVFHIFTVLDGEAVGIPAFTLAPAPSDGDKEYHIEKGERYYDDAPITDVMLHEEWLKFLSHTADIYFPEHERILKGVEPL